MTEINRDIYLKPFTKDNFPRLKCSVCNDGYIKLNDKATISRMTEKSDVLGNLTGDYDGAEGHSIFIATCDNFKCKEITTVCANSIAKARHAADVAASIAEPYWISYENKYQIIYTYPAITIIEVSPYLPSQIKNILRESFSLFWNHPCSAGNKIRNIIEFTLDNKGIIKQRKNKSRKIYYLTLHERLKEFEKKEKEIAKNLMGLKWLGNAGSHKSSINKEDLLDAYEVLDYVLEEIYNKKKRAQKVRKISRTLTKKFKKRF